VAKPELKTVTLTIDGRDVEAPEGTMLIDAARQGDVEIPYFCYEPKLGQPVGACRMCLVEIEGIPKLQTSCSTAVRNGMVVHTTTDRVQTAQNSIIEFLLVNHPLDCPVCDKGGECPLQDFTFGWGRGISRVIEPKRHFVKPLALSPLIAIDRERCILCYRCVRFSQEIAEDWQLIFTERGAHTFVGTHDGHPYVAPFSGNIIELCPVGALTSRPYRFRARPWDIEGAGGICTLCPSQCNVEFTVRDDKVERVLSREHDGVDDGWLCDKGRFAYQAIHVDERITEPLVRDPATGELQPATWAEAIAKAATIAEHNGSAAALVGGQASNEEAFLLQRFLREGLQSGAIASRSVAFPRELAVALADPARQATVEDLEWSDHVVLFGCEPRDDAPILDLRIRKGVRRHGTKLTIISDRPSALDPNAAESIRYAPGDAGIAASQIPTDGEVVVVWHERIGTEAAAKLLALDSHVKLLEIPAGSNGRGVREAGALPDAGPGYAPLSAPQTDDDVPTASAIYLLQSDPVRESRDRGRWERLLDDASLVIAHASVLTEGIAAYADVVFPAESSAEKEGTVVHPDGRVQRLRAAIAHPGQVRATWQVISDVAKATGTDLKVLTSAMAFKQLVAAVPFYAGLTLEEIGGRGVRWPATDAASAFPTAPAAAGDEGGGPQGPPSPQPSGSGSATPTFSDQLRLGTYRSIWASPEVEISPALHFTIATQIVELAPEDAQRLNIQQGQPVTVAQNGTRLAGTAEIRTGVPAGTVFVADGLAHDSANALHQELVEVKPA
jgi:NADH-quinone oxidoreductase subunit G